MIRRWAIVATTAALALSACASAPSFSSNRAAPVLPQIPPEEVFVTAVRDICFGALERNISEVALADMRGFQLFEDVSSLYRQSTDDVLYNAVFASAPVIVLLNGKDSECSVLAVRGDYGALKYLAEVEIENFSNKYGANAPDHIAFVSNDIQQNFVLKFTLLSGSSVDNAEE